MARTDKDGVVTPYQHEVEVDDDDPDLYMDQLFDQLQKQADAVFGRKFLMRWYFYPHPLTVRQIRRWDPSDGEYV